MKTTHPLRAFLVLFSLAIAAPLIAAPKSFIGLSFDFKGDPRTGSGLSFINPVIMAGWVTYVVPKSPADGHHITAGDVVLEINGTPVPGLRVSAFEAKFNAAPGETIHLKLRRSNGEIYIADLTAIPKTW